MRLRYVGYCPRCDSPRTGYFLNTIPSQRLRIKKFKNGERVKFFSITDDKYLNCFCSVCHHRWHQELPLLKLGDQDFNDYLHEFEFYDERNEIRERMKAPVKPQKKELTLEEKSKRYKKVTTILAYTVGIDIRKWNPYAKKLKENADEEE